VEMRHLEMLFSTLGKSWRAEGGDGDGKSWRPVIPVKGGDGDGKSWRSKTGEKE